MRFTRSRALRDSVRIFRRVKINLKIHGTFARLPVMGSRGHRPRVATRATIDSGGWCSRNTIGSWSLMSSQLRLVKTGGRLVKHARYYWLLLAEGHLPWWLFGSMLRRIAALPVPTG